MGKFAAALAFLLLVILLIVIGPILTIWALNVLFHLGIPFTVKTWFAAFFLTSIVSGGAKAAATKLNEK